ncbi:hypothetical protein AB0O91_00290 [Kitasatospora sp. NPDC089797]|uniref:hypothetical protein n=1 Tax=Kitasatospora sp. NPDC089797 TaxID=3155298 RepID=UPI00343F4E7C
MNGTVLQLQELIDTAVEDTVNTASPVSGRWMITELERRGPETVWAGACALLAPLAATPGDVRTQRPRDGAQPDVALALAVRLAFRVEGVGAAAEIWRAADGETQRAALMHWLIIRCLVFGFGGDRLDAAGAVALIRETFLPRPSPPLR